MYRAEMQPSQFSHRKQLPSSRVTISQPIQFSISPTASTPDMPDPPLSMSFSGRVELSTHIATLKARTHTITNVYQPTYKNVTATGIGDFLRGCYFLCQFCNQYGFGFRVKINHPLAEHLGTSPEPVNPNMERFDENNFISSILDKQNYLIGVVTQNDYIYVLLVNHLLSRDPSPDLHICTICFPKYKTTPYESRQILSFFKPSPQTIIDVSNILTDLNLPNRGFIVIHVRAGDRFLIKNTDDTSIIPFINAHIAPIIKTAKMPILLITDYAMLKQAIRDKYDSSVRMLTGTLIHFGEGVECSGEDTKGTIHEFFAMSRANYIYAFSFYRHGSGFSQWCANLNKIPYQCKILTG